MLSTVTRPIAPLERKALEVTLAYGEPAVTLGGTVKWVLACVAAVGVLGLLGYYVVKVSGPLVGGLLSGGAAMIALVCTYAIIALIASYRNSSGFAHRFRRDDVPEIHAALADGTVRATRVQASAVVAIEEFEDEGSGFVFDVGDAKLLFVKGQRYEPADDGQSWPNSDFQIVRTVVGDRWVGIFCEGTYLKPADVLQTADCLEDLVWAEREEVVEAELGDFVRSIRRAPGDGEGR